MVRSPSLDEIIPWDRSDLHHELSIIMGEEWTLTRRRVMLTEWSLCSVGQTEEIVSDEMHVKKRCPA